MNIQMVKSNEIENLDFSKLKLFQQFISMDNINYSEKEKEKDYNSKITTTIFCNVCMDCIYHFESMSIDTSCCTHISDYDSNEIHSTSFSTDMDDFYYLNINNKNIRVPQFRKHNFDLHFAEVVDILISESNNQIYCKDFYKLNNHEFDLLIPFDNGYLLYKIDNNILPKEYHWKTTLQMFIINKNLTKVYILDREVRQQNMLYTIQDILNEIQNLDITKDSKYFDYYMNTIIPLHEITFKEFDKYENTFYELFNEIKPNEIKKFFKPIYENEKYNFKVYKMNNMLNYYKYSTLFQMYDKNIDDKILKNEKRKSEAVFDYLINKSRIDIYTGEVCENKYLKLVYRDSEGIIFNNRDYSSYMYYILLDNIYVIANRIESREISNRKGLLDKLIE